MAEDAAAGFAGVVYQHSIAEAAQTTAVGSTATFAVIRTRLSDVVGTALVKPFIRYASVCGVVEGSVGVDAAGKTVPRGIARATVVVGAGHTRTVISVSIGFDGTEGTVAAVVHSVAD